MANQLHDEEEINAKYISELLALWEQNDIKRKQIERAQLNDLMNHLRLVEFQEISDRINGEYIEFWDMMRGRK